MTDKNKTLDGHRLFQKKRLNVYVREELTIDGLAYEQYTQIDEANIGDYPEEDLWLCFHNGHRLVSSVASTMEAVLTALRFLTESGDVIPRKAMRTVYKYSEYKDNLTTANAGMEPPVPPRTKK